MPEITVYTTGEAAKLLGVHKKTVQHWCNQGSITAYRTSPIGHWRIIRADLVEYAHKNGIPLRELSNGNN